ncbi:hypothetical protein G9C98_003856 [Cotesia typhae]|uniref:DUF4789 domain-containing protein n=1 Tax=Cotesia typhae TaxID=2053667 RepID=A0A8J5RBT0_9HYME|nr:hypothetical protein G9C98_003856 [Cotesia typhae]
MITEIFLFFSLIGISLSQDIAFPDDDDEIKIRIHTTSITPKTTTSTTSTTPFKISEISVKVCPVNMTAITENGKTICECVAGYVYYLPLDSCFLPYSRGPCTSGYHLAFPNGAMTVECLKNPCGDDSVVYQNKCHKFLKSGSPCPEGQTLTVNEENYEIMCQEVMPIIYQLIVTPTKRCSAGSRMAARGICRQLL